MKGDRQLTPGRVRLVGWQHCGIISVVCRSVEAAERAAAIWSEESEDEDGFTYTFAAPIYAEDHEGAIAWQSECVDAREVERTRAAFARIA